MDKTHEHVALAQTVLLPEAGQTAVLSIINNPQGFQRKGLASLTLYSCALSKRALTVL